METTNNLLWLDLETGGLDPNKVSIFEVGAIVTDGDLNELARLEQVVVHKHFTLTPWAYHYHTKSGLLTESMNGESCAQVEKRLCGFIIENGCEGAPLAGSSVDFDRRFLAVHMGMAYGLLGYRNVDVSCLTELAKRWLPEKVLADRPPQRNLHRAIPDLEDSINLARYYRRFFQVPA